MENDFEPLTVQEEMWAEMLMDVLRSNHIPCTALPTIGAGLATKTGKQKEFRIYVPRDLMVQAQVLVDQLFSGTAE